MGPEDILIAGASGSGKTTLARAISSRLKRLLLSLDDHYMRGGRPIMVPSSGGASVRTYEDPSLYDGNGLAQKVAGLSEAAIVEGFCLFAYPAMLALPGRRYYLETPFSLCLSRRLARRPQRPSDSSFEAIGEAETERWVIPQRDLPGVISLDGCLPPGVLVEQILGAA